MKIQWWLRGTVIVLCTVTGMGLRFSTAVQARTVGATGKIVSQAAGSGTLTLHGSLDSVAQISMTGAFSVGQAHNLTWNLPRLTSLQENGYTEQFDSVSYRFDVQPDSFHDAEVDGRAVRQFMWQSPPAETVIHVTQTFRATVHTELSPFTSTAMYPMTPVAPETASYLTVTPLVQLPTSVKPVLTKLSAGKRNERSVVAAVINWVAAHTTYDAHMTGNQVSAANVLTTHRAICRGYDNLATGMLRALGIPVRTEFGWVSSGRLDLPGPNHGSSYVRWATPGSSGELHAWLSVYFPDVGWVAFDPQREKFFVDPHHVAFFSSIDAGSPATGAWTADYYGESSPTGAPLANGGIEIVPGDGMSSTVTVHTVDSIHASLGGFQHDVHGVLLFSR